MKIESREKPAPQRCVYCHAGDGELESCNGCGARLHRECWRELSRCPTLGCAASVRAPDVAAGSIGGGQDNRAFLNLIQHAERILHSADAERGRTELAEELGRRLRGQPGFDSETIRNMAYPELVEVLQRIDRARGTAPLRTAAEVAMQRTAHFAERARAAQDRAQAAAQDARARIDAARASLDRRIGPIMRRPLTEADRGPVTVAVANGSTRVSGFGVGRIFEPGKYATFEGEHGTYRVVEVCEDSVVLARPYDGVTRTDAKIHRPEAIITVSPTGWAVAHELERIEFRERWGWPAVPILFVGRMWRKFRRWLRTRARF